MIGAFGTVTKGFLKCLEDLVVGGRVETIQTTVLLRTARMLRLAGTCCHANSSGRPSAGSDVKKKKNSKGVNNNNNNKSLLLSTVLSSN